MAFLAAYRFSFFLPLNVGMLGLTRSNHPETPDETRVVSSSEARIYYLGKELGIVWIRADPRRTIKTDSRRCQAEKNRWRMEIG